MTPQEIKDNEMFIDAVSNVYMQWPKEDLVNEILEFMSVEDYKKVLREFSEIDEIKADFAQFEKESQESMGTQ